MSVSKRTRYEVLRRDNNTCRYCGGTAPDVTLTIDHVTPVSLGGSDDPSNLVAACKDCNAGKSSSNPDAALVASVSDDALRWAAALKAAAAAAVADPIDRARQLMTITPLSPSPITASVRRRYLTGIGHPPPTATVSTVFGWQNPKPPIPDHGANRIQGGQNQRPAAHSTLVPLCNRQIRSSTGAKSP